MSDDKQTPAELIQEHDKEKRIEDETIILAKVGSLTNGNAGDATITGEVLQWQVKETIAQGVLLRSLVSAIGTFQLKSACVLAHKPKNWAVRIFGFSFAAPITLAVGILGFLVFSVCRKNGWV